MKVVRTGGFEFCFTDALDAFVFDESDNTRPRFHGAPMKAVDIVAEFKNAYVYVELKDYDDPSVYDVLTSAMDNGISDRQENFRWLKNYLKYKFRDSYLYRYAEEKVEKDVHYICLLTFDNALNSRMQKSLRKELPVGRPSHHWIRELAKSCKIVNLDKWNKNFPKWPVKRLD